MVKQINLDSWQVEHLTNLLKRGAMAVRSTKSPIILYRQSIEESGESYEEIVCTLCEDHVVEQVVVYGGPIPLHIKEQKVFGIESYSMDLNRDRSERFQKIVALLMKELEAD